MTIVDWLDTPVAEEISSAPPVFSKRPRGLCSRTQRETKKKHPLELFTPETR